MFATARAGISARAQVLRDDVATGWAEGKLAAQGPTEADKVSVGMTYVCFLFGGLIGAHRIWMGRRFWPTILYAVTGGYLLLGWAWDLFTIPAQVARINDKVDRAIAKHQRDRDERKAERSRT